ncbi:MAG: type II toxin-antitoxin system HicA family toxin [Cyclobacteriaceae bacterium]
MTKIDKLIQRLLSRPRNFTYDELVKVLNHFGYDEIKKGKTAGSRRAFVNEVTKHVVRLHKPHPGNILKMYVIDYVIGELKDQRLL